MNPAVMDAVSAFGAEAKAKLANPAASGEPEDQIRAPFETLLTDLSAVAGFQRNAITLVGESSVSALHIRPDYAITANRLLIGFVELKAPGKGADPRKFKNPHDKKQWEKLRSLPNLMYSDGNEFSLWQNGELIGEVIRLDGDVETSGSQLAPHPGLAPLFDNFLHWVPIPPRSVLDLARISARLCRLLRDEVTEQLGEGSPALTTLAEDWRELLFPDATDAVFADGYAQAVTFGLLMARAKGISLGEGLEQAGHELAQTSTLIGTALHFLTENAESQKTLKTSLETLKRVLDVVSWEAISKGKPEAWLYFYEDFLSIYDNKLRKQTGSYYTPPEVVQSMIRLVDEALRSDRFKQHRGIASPAVTIADPAIGTGTFMLGVLRKIAETIEADEGSGAVSAAVAEAVSRLIAFELQFGPFAVAQLRILAELKTLAGDMPTKPLRMYVTNTLSDPDDDSGWIPGILAPIGTSRKEANKIKREEKITVVIGNPPYKEKAKGRGAWVEGASRKAEKAAPLAAWKAPRDWGVGAHAKHLRNLYVYFWRWATWKVFDQNPANNKGMVCFITVAGFLNGPGFQKMRDYLRRTCDDIWVIGCSPEGHQPAVNTRVFQYTQHEICIVLASRSAKENPELPATVKFRSLAPGDRREKFAELAGVSLGDGGWSDCPQEWRAPFLPVSQGMWSLFPALNDFFLYNGSGVMPGRTWVIAPDPESLRLRWKRLVNAPEDKKEELFHPHLRKGEPGDKHVHRAPSAPLAGYPPSRLPVAEEKGDCLPPVQYGFRSFDRQWIISDSRLINQPNPALWNGYSDGQVYITAPSDRSPTAGPALTISSLVPDLHHYNGRGGRTFPLWADAKHVMPNIRPGLVSFLKSTYGCNVTVADIFAYIVAIAAHPAYTNRFQADLSTPGLRIPLTAAPLLFAEAAEIGREAIWLHTFGERMADPDKGRPVGPPRLPDGRRPSIPADGAIPRDPDDMPDSMDYDPRQKRLRLGSGFVENVEPAVWEYEVSGKQVLTHWFSYRRKNRERPIIGDRRQPSPLGDIQPDHWLAEYTTELLNVLNVLGLLVDLEPRQADLLKRICAGELLSIEELERNNALAAPKKTAKKKKARNDPGLLD